MKPICFFVFFVPFVSSCSGQEKVSAKVFDEIALVNAIQFYNSKFDQQRFSCGFLLKYNTDTFAVTAKHLLKVIKPEEMTTLSFANIIKSWSLYPLDRKNEVVITDSLLNENKGEHLADKSTYTDDWLLFSLKENHSKVKTLEVRATPLVPGEKLYVIGWTRKMESGQQRVYEFEYLKTIDHRILLKEVVVPQQFGGLSGAPLVDEQGAVVGIVSNGTVDPASNKKYFSPCVLDGLISFIEKYQHK
jgi:hypothetical protein